MEGADFTADVTTACTVYVRGLPKQHCNEEKITQLLTAIGKPCKVISVTPRLKDGENKCWALATFSTPQPVAKCISSRITVQGPKGSSVPVKVVRVQIEKQLTGEGVKTHRNLMMAWQEELEKIRPVHGVQQTVTAKKSASLAYKSTAGTTRTASCKTPTRPSAQSVQDLLSASSAVESTLAESTPAKSTKSRSGGDCVRQTIS